jgi:N-acetylmuramoyl-L-alanine amidase
MPRLPLFLAALLILTACGPTTPAATPAALSATAVPTSPPAPSATAAPTAPPAPSATAAPTSPPAPSATAEPSGPPRVGVQVGHWKLAELPDELARFKIYSGTYWGGYDEWEMNIVIAEALRDQLEAAGMIVDLLPATVPIGYQADAFVSIHIDGVTGEQAEWRHGYKVAAPYRSSPAGLALAQAVAESYAQSTGLPEDPLGPSFNMRAHYIFSPHRFWHSVAPTTPSIMVECGFATHPTDRQLIFEQPDLIATGIAEGILAFLSAQAQAGAASREPAFIPSLRPVAHDTPLFEQPAAEASVEVRLDPTFRLFPYAQIEGWYLVQTQDRWDLGWVRAEDVAPSDDPQRPRTPKPSN